VSEGQRHGDCDLIDSLSGFLSVTCAATIAADARPLGSSITPGSYRRGRLIHGAVDVALSKDSYVLEQLADALGADIVEFFKVLARGARTSDWPPVSELAEALEVEPAELLRLPGRRAGMPGEHHPSGAEPWLHGAACATGSTAAAGTSAAACRSTGTTGVKLGRIGGWVREGGTGRTPRQLGDDSDNQH
jgi:hypothetical protein